MSTIALSVICCNEEPRVDRFFGSIDFSQFDQVVVVDTGSTDATLEKLEAWRPKINNLVIKQIEWEYDFAKARQASMDLCETEYLMWADFDDVLEGTEHIKRLLHEMPQVDAISFKYNYSRDERTDEVNCVLWRERIVRISKYKWKSRLHEVLVSEEPTLGVESDFVVFNHYPVPTDGLAKAQRNIEILKMQVAEDPNEPRTYFYLGNYYMGVRDYDNAVENYLIYCSKSEWDLERYQAASRVCRVYMTQNRLEEAKRIAIECINLMPDYPLGYYIMGELYSLMGYPEKALSFVETGLSKPLPKFFAAENPADYTYVPKVMKLDLLAALGRNKEAYAWGSSIDSEIKEVDLREKYIRQMCLVEQKAEKEKLLEELVHLRSYLIANDEIEKAAKLTECVPYTLETINHVKQMKINDKLNFKPQTHDNIAAVEQGYQNKEDVLNLEKHNIKAAYLMQWLKQYPDVKTILDVGCNWGWFDFWLESKGYEVVGVDMNEECLQVAAEKKKIYESNVTFVKDIPKDKKFDLVIAFDIIEHVTDDKAFVETLMEATNKHVLVATPNGCFSRGMIHNATDGTTQPHLRVYTPKSLNEACAPYKVDSMARIHNDLLLMAHILKEKRSTKKLGIFCGQTPEPWGPDSLVRGVGGSEEAVILLSREFQRMGYEVTVFNRTRHSIVEGVEWLDPEQIDPNDYYDVMVAWRSPDFFRNPYIDLANIGKKYVWMHDVPRKDMFNPTIMERLDGVFVLSEFHKSLLPECAKEKAIVSANGLDHGIIRDIKKDNQPHKMVWTSSYLRGLEWLLEAWPDIRKEVPDAELNVMYGWETTDASPPFPPNVYEPWREKINKLLEQEGVTHHGRLPQDKVLEIMGQSGVFPYLTKFPEISCISCMKAQAMGAVPFTSDTAALKETNRGGIQVSPEGEVYDNYKEHVAQLIKLLKDENKQKKLRQKGFKEALDFSWKKVAKQWDEIFTR